MSSFSSDGADGDAQTFPINVEDVEAVKYCMSNFAASGTRADRLLSFASACPMEKTGSRVMRMRVPLLAATWKCYGSVIGCVITLRGTFSSEAMAIFT